MNDFLQKANSFPMYAVAFVVIAVIIAVAIGLAIYDRVTLGRGAPPTAHSVTV